MALGIAADIGKIRDFESLLKYLQRSLDWPIDLDEIDELTFEYQPEELGLDEECRVKIKEIKHLRPLSSNQPWGIFWIEFENRHLPVVVMRRILRALVPKKRASARPSDRPVWNRKDLLFISSLGEHGHRRITFSHFREEQQMEPTLETFSWDERETHFYYLERLHMDRLRWPASPSDAEGWRRQWAGAFTSGHREPIRTAKELSEELAALAARTRDLVVEVLKYERSDGPLHRLFESFQKVLIHDLKEDGFADMVAQTIAYGLFSARCTGQEVLGLAHLEAMVPNTNRFLKELFAELAAISGHRKGQINFDDLGLSEMVDLLKNTNIEAVLEDFGRQTGGGKEDPVVHFYETFLHVYDKEQKVQRGVFYTPKPVVSFIVRSVHETLQREFGLPDGLADTTTWQETIRRNPRLRIPAGVKPDEPFVQILDPATGTGTFLEEVIEVVHKTMTAKWDKQGMRLAQQHQAWNSYVAECLLPRLHGFELMMAPYSVAHMKLGLKLRQTGYDFKSNQQLRLYLTNTLEPPEKGNRKLSFLPDFLSHESMQADQVKERKAITVVIGNPPYSGVSANMTEHAQRIVDAYKIVDGAALNERKLWLQDDYVKFIRTAQAKLEVAGAGVLGFITNHGYLDNPTFRGMRQSLLGTFGKLWILDLHGNTNKGETTPEGQDDKNVFDIRQGVAICVASRDGAEEGAVRHSDLWGLRESKYERLSRCSFRPEWTMLEPTSPFYFLVPRDESAGDEYGQFVAITELFPTFVSAPVTARDHFVIAFTEGELLDRIAGFRDGHREDEEVRAEIFTGHTRSRKYPPGDSRGWKLPLARARCQRDSNWRSRSIVCSYRAFDNRCAYWADWMIDWPRPELAQHVVGKKNLCLVTRRQMLPGNVSYFLVTDHMPIDGVLRSDNKGGESVFPLYLYNSTLGKHGATSPNVSKSAARRIGHDIGLSWIEEPRGDLQRSFGVEDLFAYVYAVFYSQTYRSQYEEQIRIDFPRVPTPRSLEMFRRLVQAGHELTQAHLLSVEPSLVDKTIKKVGTGVVVEIVSYSKRTVWIDRQQKSGFEGVSELAWHFQVGAHQVCEKWLKDRRGRRLSKDDLDRYAQVLVVISETVRLMKHIDLVVEQYGGFASTGHATT